ncbi:MAG: formyltransferase family protein [Pacificimonas sp.]
MRIFLLSHDRARRGTTVARVLKTRDIVPDGFVFEAYRPKPLRRRIENRLADGGIPVLAPKTPAVGGADRGEGGPDVPVAADHAASADIPVINVADLTSEASLETLRALKPDIFIHAGAGILRAPLLAIPRLGTINAHMGILPRYRGMNVAEWSRMEGRQTGCTVHLLDPGIDTGDILITRNIDTSDCASVAMLRARMDKAQLDLLAEVMADIVRTGELPPRQPQTDAGGRQYFAMHSDLKAVLETRLSRTAMRADV